MELKAEFEALVGELCFSEGQQVQTGDVVLRLNLMKMIFPISAPQFGSVHYNVVVEDYVQKGQVLARIE